MDLVVFYLAVMLYRTSLKNIIYILYGNPPLDTSNFNSVCFGRSSLKQNVLPGTRDIDIGVDDVEITNTISMQRTLAMYRFMFIPR